MADDETPQQSLGVRRMAITEELARRLESIAVEDCTNLARLIETRLTLYAEIREAARAGGIKYPAKGEAQET